MVFLAACAAVQSHPVTLPHFRHFLAACAAVQGLWSGWTLVHHFLAACAAVQRSLIAKKTRYNKDLPYFDRSELLILSIL